LIIFKPNFPSGYDFLYPKSEPIYITVNYLSNLLNGDEKVRRNPFGIF